MTENQEDALYDFLENITEPFTLEDVMVFVRMVDFSKNAHLAGEIASFIDSQNVAFRLGKNQWVSRRGCFEPVRFVISPTRSELLNGILIPGHRCIPFANPALLPQEYSFYWKGSSIPYTTTEGPPDEFYPYYTIFGEEYAPQYVARDNPENETAFNSDPYDDPPDVSIQTLDMRNIYRETSFVPGDRFVARTMDWKKGEFELVRVGKDEWSQADLFSWFEAAEGGFEDSFSFLGPGMSTEEQIAHAYWYGGKRMREVPAYALEEFLYERTDRIETVAYGIETRFWYAGKEIPDRKNPGNTQVPFDQTPLEKLLSQWGIPISEYVVQSYVRDALFRNDADLPRLIERIVPPSVMMDEYSWNYLAHYVGEVFAEFSGSYSLFSDSAMGPIRQRMGELHTAVIDLIARLHKGDIDISWLPKHTYIILSQIQDHAAGVLEDMDADEAPPAAELEAMDNSLDSMIEAYEDMKELIEEALASFRRNNISVVKFNGETSEEGEWRTVQISLGGTEVWRRVILPGTYSLEELHRVIRILFDWNGMYDYRFIPERAARTLAEDKALSPGTLLGELPGRGTQALLYEYGSRWTLRVTILSRHDAAPGELVRCVAGAGAAPPEGMDGPLRFRRFISALAGGSDTERQRALHELGQDFDPDLFDMEAHNRRLASEVYQKNQEPGPIKMDF
ncbi:MAG: plasmid pRiA4b ORF-3 family protein [Spirochaetaceae bacterium]|jgi:hypothetical protein|nr:plasmid pRiA4b ORF-3 family protein [Spirochaetaceae bacterium]